jgi:bacterioferritin
MLKSYVEYEEKLIPHYNGEADEVDDSHIRRVLQREAWESAIHARKFQRKLDKLSPEEAAGLPGGESELPKEFLETLQVEVTSKYKDEMIGWKIMDQAMEKMRQLAHFAEPVAEDGVTPKLKLGKIDMSQAIGMALKKALEDVQDARERHVKLRQDSEVQKHSGLVINLDLTIQQEEYQEEELGDWRRDK